LPNFSAQSLNLRFTRSISEKKLKAFSISRVAVVGSITIMMLLVLAFYPFSMLSLLQQQEAQATAFGLGNSRVPPAYIIVDGKASKLQLENSPFPSEENTIADYDRPIQGTISFGERFQLLVPQVQGVFKDVQRTTLWVNSDEFNAQDDFHVSKKRIDVRDASFLYTETYVIDAPGGVGDGFTANEIGFKIFLWWQVLFTDGTEQTYVAILHLQGDPCEEHGWDRQGTKCVDFDF
jgi:hypothetical protein